MQKLTPLRIPAAFFAAIALFAGLADQSGGERRLELLEDLRGIAWSTALGAGPECA